ncbi:TRAP transporter large permease [Falsiroseomonas selenitidurans]|uniref:TRAP transporter large permease protein n=1 Tax=Falsiroseomonas selenitidurans TaxID=2716335 RepID=A0ABX1DYZ9_9PROT|nr:TRAP transporter large permease subunit [Falsiroseomonas selenitidurans]NKC29595.1 TRAP transporter large permease subunit [Falsiroseomonas selenitidurans]
MTAPLLLVLGMLVATLAGGVWVGVALMSIGVVALDVFRDMRVDRFLAGDIWSSATAVELVTLPLFILMGEILFHTRLSENLFKGLSPWTRRLPGRLLHVNVLGCTLFAAVSGSSAATTATVGRITLQELLSRGYDRRLAVGSLAGAGTLGFLIPPSIPMIVYGVVADVSILELFMAGLVPGLGLALLFMGYIAVRALRDPALVPPQEAPIAWPDALRALLQLLPIGFLISFIMGSLYFGFASITEAAAIGVLGALLVAVAQRTLTLAGLWGALMGTVKTCSMIGLIIVGALFLSKAMARLGLPADVANAIQSWGLHPFALIFVLLLFYLALGCILDGLSAIVMTLPVTLPLAVAAGFDPIWFGVFLIITIEMAQITPPVGFNLFVIQGLTKESILRVAGYAMPFCILMMVFTALITVFPQIVTALPASLRG